MEQKLAATNGKRYYGAVARGQSKAGNGREFLIFRCDLLDSVQGRPNMCGGLGMPFLSEGDAGCNSESQVATNLETAVCRGEMPDSNSLPPPLAPSQNGYMNVLSILLVSKRSILVYKTRLEQ